MVCSELAYARVEIGCEIGYEIGYETGYDIGYEIGYGIGYGIGYEMFPVKLSPQVEVCLKFQRNFKLSS